MSDASFSASFPRPFPKFDSFTIRAYPPTHFHAAQFLRSAAYSQRNLIAAQFLLFLANQGGPQGWDPWDPKEGPPWGPWAPLLRTEGPLRGPWAQGGPSPPPGVRRLRRPWAHGGRWDDFEAIANGMFFRWCIASQNGGKIGPTS